MAPYMVTSDLKCLSGEERKKGRKNDLHEHRISPSTGLQKLITC